MALLLQVMVRKEWVEDGSLQNWGGESPLILQLFLEVSI